MKHQAAHVEQPEAREHVPAEASPGQGPGLQARLWRAFSLRRNLRSLVVPADSHDLPVNGLRALSILWVLAVHTIWFLALTLPVHEFRGVFDRYENDVLIRWINRGELGVDLFFVLSGYLIGSLLMQERNETGSLRIGLFYTRRFMRLMPAYWFTLLLLYLAGAPNTYNAWANLLYINNFIPFERAFMAPAWSLAIEEQFYFVFPLFLLGFYRVRAARLTLLVVLLALGIVIRGVVIHQHNFTLPIVLHPVFDGPRAYAYFDALYVKPHTRYGALLTGVIVAYLLKYTRIRDVLRRRPGLELGILLGGVSCMVLVATVPVYSELPWPGRLDMAYLAASTTIFSTGASGLLLVVLAGSGASRFVARSLSSRLWLPIAQLSYSAYLVHPLIIAAIYLTRKPKGPSATSFTPMFACNVVATLLASLILYCLIEKPIMNLRPSARLEPR